MARGSFKIFTESFIQVFITYFLIVGVVDSDKKVIKVIWVITICTGIYSILGLVDYVNQENLILGRVMGRAVGLYGDPSDLAISLCLSMVFIFFFIKITRSSVRRLFLYGIIGVSLATIVFTYSRTGMITLGIVFLGLLAKSKKKLKVAFILVMVTIVLVSLGSERFTRRAASIFDGSRDEVGARQSRIDLWGTAIQAIWERPLTGVGLGNFRLMKEAIWHGAHNGYLEIAAELGILGLCLLLALLSSTFFNLRKMQKALAERSNHTAYLLCQFIEISLWAYLGALMFASYWYGWIFFYLVGFSVSMRRWLSAQTHIEDQLPVLPKAMG